MSSWKYKNQKSERGKVERQNESLPTTVEKQYMAMQMGQGEFA
jgi:hypothetical protein|tara:strand:+ start:164 stop:292 length:129 start_codon:yes stop_codon:yes gene_type:complete